MRYEKPTIEITYLDTEDVIRTSLNVEQGGGGSNEGGDGTSPWE